VVFGDFSIQDGLEVFPGFVGAVVGEAVLGPPILAIRLFSTISSRGGQAYTAHGALIGGRKIV
jgi:hypothetical protein